ncbi:OGFD2-like protein [Mya arenaria]|uniref:OGFD2-like protein n=1 Tax=Mya arenaria TaxID=6604 RepID=A0ABY7E546_MYAAR|nr:2-oxoglutarate and iron-dependent oxygenase domain-containing protein 2-like [Mya arenaria]WAR03661.1 OGFD2-like protein [Mya arenaria]
MGKFCICSCFLTQNIFVRILNCHVEYTCKAQFLQMYHQMLAEKSQSDLEQIILQISNEISRRKNLFSDSLERKSLIQQQYHNLHPHIFTLKESFLAPQFLQLVNYCRQEDATFEGVFHLINETNIERTYTFPVFTEEFCKEFLEEILHFEDSSLPKGRPNTMNNHGVLLEELGFDGFITELRERYLGPVCHLLYPDWCWAGLDSHKAFIVQYSEGGDVDLAYHYDNAEVTLNVALSPEGSYKGGDLFFGAMKNEFDNERLWKSYRHVPCFGILHRGQHRHGAYPIETGSRYNMIMWMRSSSVRNKKCPMCGSVPDLVEVDGYGDGFTSQTVDVCSLT